VESPPHRERGDREERFFEKKKLLERGYYDGTGTTDLQMGGGDAAVPSLRLSHALSTFVLSYVNLG